MKTPADELIPKRPTIASAREAACGCQACDLWKRGTQTVFGEGPRRARLMLIGGQPGDQEDRTGHPFVGPAGRVLDVALEAAGIDRTAVSVTNVVKHFKWEPRGKKRIHQRPNPREIAACRAWLDTEIRLVKPHAIVCLGATAAQTLLGAAFKVTQRRGRPVVSPLAPFVMATVHPSSLLRAPDNDTRQAETKRFVHDLRVVAKALSS